MLRDKLAGSATLSQQPGKQGKSMSERELSLGSLGIAVSESHVRADASQTISGHSFSAYGSYTAVTIRSKSVRTDNAGMERDQSRD